MSLPLTRRIAQAALLMAAGAAPVVGAAASASAAGLEPVTQSLGPVSAMDADALGSATGALNGADTPDVVDTVSKVQETAKGLPVQTPASTLPSLGGLPLGG
ncbi:ATP-binding protein [Streptomyces sp. WAC06614]|nr:ATP-binding protein [Streptomyces sp. WAC06614]